MKIKVDKSVTYDIANVVVPNISILNNMDTITVVVPYQWLDASDHVIRQGMSRYTEDQLSSFSSSASTMADAFRHMAPSNTSSCITIIPTQETKFKAILKTKTNNIWSTPITYSADQLEGFLAESNIAFSDLNNLIVGFTNVVLVSA